MLNENSRGMQASAKKQTIPAITNGLIQGQSVYNFTKSNCVNFVTYFDKFTLSFITDCSWHKKRKFWLEKLIFAKFLEDELLADQQIQ